ncbi:thioredoxin reductase [Winogradskyella sediminis]|nr:thioredoxin reductase [Winogradskyella sediminis]
MTRRDSFKLLGATSLALVLPQPLLLFAQKNNSMAHTEFEVIIIGGSYAGLSTALTLGRSRRKTLLIDAGQPCNQQTPHSHNFLTQDGKTPKDIADVAKSQVAKYPSIHFYNGFANSAKRSQEKFEITTSNGEIFTAKKLVLATGIKDLMPAITGFNECWGISVVHCPYCHGYEIRNKNTAIIANGEHAFHLAALVINLTSKVTIITANKDQFNEHQLKILKQNNIRIIEKDVSAIQHQNGQLKSLIFKDATSEDFDCAYASIPFELHSNIAASLGCEFTEHGHIKVNPMQKTTVEGVFACGDNSSPMRSVANAVQGGNFTGAVINNELSKELF